MGGDRIQHLMGLDIGSNSVGSAWIDLVQREINCGVSVFPAGVDETDEARGAPKNQERRSKRSLRRLLARRSARKRKLRILLMEHGLLPADADACRQLFSTDPYELRARGLDEQLDPFQFGRVLLHLCQRRGALGLNLPDSDEKVDEDGEQKKKKSLDDSEGKVKEGIQHVRMEMKLRNARTFGELLCMVGREERLPVLDDEKQPKVNENGEVVTFGQPLRNRLDSHRFHADRQLIRDEFEQLWNKQLSLGGTLATKLTADLRTSLDNPQRDSKWRHQGALFGQRQTYWDTGTLGRCDLEPSDRCVPIADRHASYFRVLETVNNLRIRGPGDKEFRPLDDQQRTAVIEKLRSQKTGTPATVRSALKIDKGSLKKKGLAENDYQLNTAGGDDNDLNGDWFCASIVKAIGKDVWNGLQENIKEGLNRAVLKFDPADEGDAVRLRAITEKLGFDRVNIDALVDAWHTRPNLERRLKMSRRAIENLTPYMEKPSHSGRWRTQIEARQAFAEDLLAKAEANRLPDNHAMRVQARRYQIGGSKLSKADRRYVRKHGLLPPAPTLSNPVVRKAVHEVRRHVIAHIRAHQGQKPDRIVIEFARETTKPKKLSDKILFRNLNRDKIRKKITDDIVRPTWGDGFKALSHNQLRAAVDRVILCIQQREVCAYSANPLGPDDNGACAYSGRTITLRMAALGNGLEVDHIIPFSRCGDNSLNNRVLCFRSSNRNKGRKTPREWWGDEFDARSAPLRFMQDHMPGKGDYFERRDYLNKWRNYSATKVPDEWQGSQLSDTAYAAREVQTYLQQALWPNEPSHLEGGQRRIFVTKGRYTAILRREWQLYESIHKGSEVSPEDMQHAQLKDRGDHREHAIDAVAIALTDGERIQELSRRARIEEEERAKAAAQGREAERIERNPITPPWGTVEAFRRQVLTRVYGDPKAKQAQGLVVSHRRIGHKLNGAFHEETLFGVVPNSETLYTGKKKIDALDPNHLRERQLEPTSDAVKRLAARYVQLGLDKDLRAAKKRAKAFVASPAFTPRKLDPSPGKSGIVRDYKLRTILRAEITRRLIALSIPRDADSFTKGDLNRILKDGPLTMPSGVPIKRIALLRTMNEPVRIPRNVFDFKSGKWTVDEGRRSGRAYLGGNNHHIEIRENRQGKWSGKIVSTYEAARRVRVAGLSAIDASEDESKGGKLIMCLAEGDTVYMREKDSESIGYFVVFKLDKPHTIQFKRHWDARQAKGRKDDEGKLVPNSEREPISVSAIQLKDLAPQNTLTPVKVSVDSLGNIRYLEPRSQFVLESKMIDARVTEIVQEALSARLSSPLPTDHKKLKSKLNGSWSWMRMRLKQQGLEQLAPQLSLAMRLAKNS